MCSLDSCLFCSNPLDNSDEHIILNSLNGRLHSKRIICSSCNQFFGSNLDPIAKKFFNPILLVLGFDNADSMTAENFEGESNFRINKAHKVNQIKPKMDEITDSGFTIINIQGDEKNALNLYNKRKAKLLAEGKKIVREEIQYVQKAGPLRANASFSTTQKWNLLLNKIALEFCGFHQVEVPEIKTLADKVRNMNLDLKNVAYVNFEEEVRKPDSGEISHLIKIGVIGTRLYVYLELLNVISAVITISENYTGANLNHQYRQDAITGKSLPDDVILNEKELPKEENELHKEKFDKSINRLFQRLREKEFKSILDDELDKIKNELSDALTQNIITAEEHNALLIQRSAKMTGELSLEFPYIFSDLDDANNDDLNYIHSNLRENQFDDFCEKYNCLMYKKIMIHNERFQIEGIEKVPIAEQNGINIIRVLFRISNSGEKFYLPYRVVLDSILSSSKKVSER